MTKNP